MTFGRETKERAFLCARNWAPGHVPQGVDAPIERGQLVAVKVGPRWRCGVVASPSSIAWVNATDADRRCTHLYDLFGGVRTRMERRWGVSSPTHPRPRGRHPWDGVVVHRASTDDNEVIVLPPRLDEG